MNPFLPDWMFAAFAIAGYELFNYLSSFLRIPKLVYVGYAIVAICLIVLGCRYIIRFFRRRRNPPAPPDPDEWKNY